MRPANGDEPSTAGLTTESGRRSTAALELVDGAPFRFRVVRDEDGGPVVGATVTALGPQGRPAADPIGADEEGWVEVPRSTSPLYRVAADWRVDAELPFLEPFDGGEVRLEIAGALVATVPDALEGDGVTVGVRLGSGRVAPEDTPDFAGRITSAEYGNGLVVRFDGIASGQYHVCAVADGTIVGEAFDVPVVGREVARVTLERGPSATLIGEVVSIEAGAPLRNVRVWRPRDGFGLFRPRSHGIGQRSDTTDASGRFELPRTPIGPISLRLDLPDGTSVTREVVVREGQETRVVRLRARGTATVRGRVAKGLLASDGRCTVVARALGDVGGLALDPSLLRALTPSSTWSDEDGRFEIGSVPTARPVVLVAMTASNDVLGVLELTEPLGEGEVRDDLLVPQLEGRAVRVRLRRPDGRPFVSQDGPRGGERHVATRVRFRESIAGRTVRGDQSLHLTTRNVLDLQSLTPGATHLEVQLQGFADAVIELTPGVHEFELALQQRRDVEVVVVDDRGRAIRGARVEADAVGAGPDDPDARVVMHATAALGRGRLQLDFARAWRLSAHAPWHRSLAGAATIPAEHQPDGPIVIELERADRPAPATITGRLVRAGRGKPVFDVTFRGIGRARAVVDGAEFEIHGLEAGPVDIVVDCGGYELISMPVDSLRPGEVRDVGELRARGATDVELVVEDESGARLDGGRAWLERLAPTAGGRADLPQRIELTRRGSSRGADRVGRATWRLHVTHPGKAPITREVVLGARVVRLHVTMKDT